MSKDGTTRKTENNGPNHYVYLIRTAMIKFQMKTVNNNHQHIKKKHSSDLNISSINIQSFRKNYIELINHLPPQTDVVFLQETNYADVSNMKILNWNLINFPRSDKIGGGTGFLIKDKITYEIFDEYRIHDYGLNFAQLESQFKILFTTINFNTRLLH